MRYQFRIGQYVRVVKIVDDMICQHIGRTGIVEDAAVGITRNEPMYAVKFGDATGHRFYEFELEEIVVTVKSCSINNT